MYVCGLRGVGGAASAATRLHLSMLDGGIDSRVACVWKSGDEGVGRVVELRTCRWWLCARALHALTGEWTHAIDLPGFDKLVADFGPDEVHIHWIRRDTISWRQLKRLHCQPSSHASTSTVPRLFVHLHDLWPLAQPRITALGPTFVAYSDWVCGRVKERGCVVERRNLILDPVYSNDANLAVRPTSSPSPEAILFGCKDGRRNPDKGFGDLAKALDRLPPGMKGCLELRVFGEDAPECLTSGVRTVFLGRIDDPRRLREEYLKARCLAFPSLHETMGLTKLEALACGCPVVAFDREACAEGIAHGLNGYVARDGDIDDFAAGLMKYLI